MVLVIVFSLCISRLWNGYESPCQYLYLYRNGLEIVGSPRRQLDVSSCQIFLHHQIPYEDSGKGWGQNSQLSLLCE